MDNIIDIELTGRSTRRDQKLWQYDYGQVLRIAGKEFPKVTEVQFSLKQSGGHTLDRIGTSNNGLLTVQIPNELLQNKGATSDYTIYAFVYLSGDGYGNTKYMIQLPVESRPEPTDPSEDPSIDPSIFKDAVNAVNASAERAETAEKSAKESADKAKEYAESAGKSKGDVEKARDNAISAICTEKESALRGIESKTVESLQKIQSQTEESQNSIKQSIADATEKKTELDGAISNATDAKGNLDKAVQSAGNAKKELESSIGKAGEAKTALDSSINSAGEKKLALDTTVEQANTVDASLKEHIGSAEQIQANVEQIGKNKADISSLNEDLGNIIYKELINGFDKDNAVDGYLMDNGNMASNPQFVTSDYFDVQENKTYYALQMVGTVKHDHVSYICFYDSAKTFITGGYFLASSCTSPNGSKYARVTFPSDETTKARCMFTSIETPDKYYPFGYEYSIITKDVSELKTDVSELKTNKVENRLYGKTMAILGDSMAKGHTLNEKQTWAYKIANRNGMVYQKLAVNGTFITTGHGDSDANCLLEQAKKINNNPDIIVINMGTNDRNKNVELGTWTISNTDTTNLFGALRVAFTYLAENFPLAQVMFITPYYYQEQTDYIGSIENACMAVGWHCKNNKQGGIWAWNTDVKNALFLDIVHLNEVGQERASYEYEGFMRTFM